MNVPVDPEMRKQLVSGKQMTHRNTRMQINRINVLVAKQESGVKFIVDIVDTLEMP